MSSQDQNKDAVGTVTSGYIVESANSQGQLFSIGDLFSAFWRHKLLIILTTLIVASLAAVLATLLTPKYKSEIVVSHVTDSSASGGLSSITSQFSGLASLAGVDLSSQADERQIVLATMQSRSFTLDFINKFNLKPLLFADRWDSSGNQWLSGEEIPTDMEAIEEFGKVRKVVDDKATNLIRVAVVWRDRDVAAVWANNLVKELNSHMKIKAIDEAQRSKQFLETELGKTNLAEMQSLIFGLIESQVNQVMLANVRDEYSLSTIDAAVASDEGEYSTPSKFVVIFLGVLLGLALGFFFAWIKYMRQWYASTRS